MFELSISHAIHAVLAALAAHSSGVCLGDGFLGIGGSSSSTDRKQQLAGYGDLSNIYNQGISQGNNASATGQGELGEAAGYDSSILNGNRSSIMSALSPQISSITGQANQNKKQQATMGTARGGGTNASNQQTQQQEQGAITKAIGGAQSGAASGLASIGSNETATGANLLGLGANAAGTLTGDASQSYATTSAQNAAAGQAAGQLAAGILFG
jgi:hypothetical protein